MELYYFYISVKSPLKGHGGVSNHDQNAVSQY